MSNNNPNKALIAAFSGQQQTLTIPKLYAQALGDINKALFLNQVIFWSSKTKRANGFFYKTYGDWCEEILLTQYQIHKITRALKKIQLISTSLRKVQGAPVLHYKANMENIYDFIAKYLSKPTSSVDSSNDHSSEPLISLDYEETSFSIIKKLHFPLYTDDRLTEEKQPEKKETSNPLVAEATVFLDSKDLIPKDPTPTPVKRKVDLSAPLEYIRLWNNAAEVLENASLKKIRPTEEKLIAKVGKKLTFLSTYWFDLLKETSNNDEKVSEYALPSSISAAPSLPMNVEFFADVLCAAIDGKWFFLCSKSPQKLECFLKPSNFESAILFIKRYYAEK